MFWHLNPKKLKPFETAFANKRKIRDEENWLFWGTYGMSALSVVLSCAFSKNSQAKYIEKPVLQNIAEQKEELTEEEKINKTKELFMQLQIMGVNHKAKRKDEA